MSFVRKSYIYLLFYVFWEFIISHGKYLGSPVFKHISFIITFGLFFLCLTKTKRIVLTTDAKLWIPFFLWTIIGSLIFVAPGIMFIWGTAFMVMLIAAGNNMKELFPAKLILWFGAIQIIGQLLQMENPSLYQLIMGSFFKADYKQFGSGLQGFTTQTGMTSAILVYTLGVYLCFYAPKRNTIINALVFLTVIFFIFLTGKRSGTFLALIIPVIVVVISTKSLSSLSKYGLPVLAVFVVLLYILLQNMSILEGFAGIDKLSRGLEMFIDEEELDLNGREILWEKAIEGFKESPLLGIGVSQFEEWAGLGTNAHNMYLQVLCEQGILGLILFITPLVFCLFHTIFVLRKNTDNVPYMQSLKFSLYVQLVFISYGVSGNPTRNAYGYMMYFCAIGLLQSFQFKPKSIRRIKKQQYEDCYLR